MLFKTYLFYKAFKPCRIILENESHRSLSTLPLWPSMHFFHQHVSCQECRSLRCFQMPAWAATVNSFSFWKHLLSGKEKKKNKITLRWRFVCIWTHVESKFFACKGACLICSLHRAEQHFLVLGSGPVKGEINSSTSLHKWSGKKWVPCLCLDYTLHVHQRHK